MDRRYPDVYYVPGRRRISTCSRASSPGADGDRTERLTLRAGDVYVLPSGYRVRLEKQLRGLGLAAGRHAPRRHAVPQALHGLRRRQVRDLEIDRQRPAEGARVREGLPRATWTRWPRSSAKDYSDIYRNRAPGRAHPPSDPEHRALARLRDPAADALAANTPTSTTSGCGSCRRPSASLCSPSSATTGPSGATTGASISPWTASTASSATS